MNSRDEDSQRKKISIDRRSLLFLLSLCLCVAAVNLSCSSKPTDLRTLLPADSLVYLETNDLAAALQPIIDSKAFNDVATSKPDLSALRGVQLAVAVSSFETSEEKLTDEHSVARIQPRFVAVADTHAWNWQAVEFAKSRINQFVNNLYGGDAKLGSYEKFGGTYLTWAASDGRKAYALILDGIIYFTNDETTIEKCLAVKRGEAHSMAKTGKIPLSDVKTLASGYVSTDGVAQIAELAGLSFATRVSDEEQVQSSVAGILPQLIRGAVTDISWTATGHSQGYEDQFKFGAPSETGAVLSETFAPASQINQELFQFVPNKAHSITLYNLDKPNIAWRALLLTSQSKVDPFAARLIGGFSNAFAAPYGVGDAELFLSGVGSNIVSMRADDQGEKPALIASINNNQTVRRSLSPDLKPDKAASDVLGFEVIRNADTMAVFAGEFIITGDSEAVMACIQTKSAGTNLGPSNVKLFRPRNSAATLSFENEQAGLIAALLSEKKTDAQTTNTSTITETRFTRTAIERITVSDFGLIGLLITQLDQ